MKTSYPLDAAYAWSRLGLQWMETMTASSRVIARRTSRPNTPVQLYTMGSEKVEAGIESANAMARRMMAGVPVTSPFAMWNAWAQVLSGGLAPYRRRAVRNARARRRS